MFSFVDFLYGIALNLLLKLFLEGAGILSAEPATLRPVQNIIAESAEPVRIPEWVKRVPEGGFAGISDFCSDIEKARQQALHSAIGQIVQNMGADYTLSHESRVSGDVHRVKHELTERLTYTARWFVSSVYENILESDIQETKGMYVCFVLVRFPHHKIDKLRKLTIGAKPGARIVSIGNGQVNLEVRENNGVEVILTEYEVNLATTNRHAGVITMFFMKVPKTACQTAQGMIDKKISVKDSTSTFSIRYPAPSPDLKSFILGSETELRIVLQGYDELGRPVTIPVNAF